MSTQLNYVKLETIKLKGEPNFNENWLKEKILQDPTILGLGDLVIKDVERNQPQGGRLDLLFVDADSDRRYEVELMLGATDESHIIRTLEYWDNERKRYPQYDHCAVIVAEDITGRFFNVINLFNSFIPIIAIKLTALRVDDKIMLQFTKVLDEVLRGDDVEGYEGETTDRAYWESKGSKESMAVLDGCFKILKELDPSIEPKYNKYYIGIVINGKPNNFVVFRAKKKFIRVEAVSKDKKKWLKRLEDIGIDVFPGSASRERTHFNLTLESLKENKDQLKEVFETSKMEFNE